MKRPNFVRMRKRVLRRARPWQTVLWLIALCCAFGCGGRQGPSPAPGALALAASKTPEAAPSQHPGGLFLYSAERNGHVSHLMGTIHVGFGFDEVMTRNARLRFDAARTVIAEMDPGTDTATRVMQAALLPAGRSLRDLVGAPLFDKLSARLSARAPESVLMSLKPWMLGVLLAMDELEHALEERKKNPMSQHMDVELLQAAAARHTPQLFLETADEQIAMLDAVSEQEQKEELAHMLSDDAMAQTRALVAAYAAGDDQALATACFDAAHMARAKTFFDHMLFERNARWLPIIEREHKAGGAFVAVGVAHLLGERGLLAELAQRGYRIQRVQ